MFIIDKTKKTFEKHSVCQLSLNVNGSAFSLLAAYFLWGCHDGKDALRAMVGYFVKLRVNIQIKHTMGMNELLHQHYL